MSERSDTPRETRSFEDVYAIQTARILELERELSECRRDAERFQWIANHGSCPFAETDSVWYDDVLFTDAIDAAIAKEKK